jgi:lia operon protein LiaF
MKKRVQVTVGIAIIVFGCLLLISNLLQINLWSYLWPLFLIGLGVWVLLRPRLSLGAPTQYRLLGEIRERGRWTVQNREVWGFISDVDLDFTEAKIPAGETTLRFHGFVGDIDLTIPEDVGLYVTSTAFVTSAKTFGVKQDYLLTGYETENSAYRDAERRVRIELLNFVTDLNVRHSTSGG